MRRLPAHAYLPSRSTPDKGRCVTNTGMVRRMRLAPGFQTPGDLNEHAPRLHSCPYVHPTGNRKSSLPLYRLPSYTNRKRRCAPFVRAISMSHLMSSVAPSYFYFNFISLLKFFFHVASARNSEQKLVNSPLGDGCGCVFGRSQCESWQEEQKRPANVRSGQTTFSL